ncbi:MAG TPA: Gfo/Idh/MocA family oxidoreductase [Chryseosolibacter sp.]|nr:Gfo/Idh/MocA family oxidoreductase [Chryseosolibacter sp.]
MSQRKIKTSLLSYGMSGEVFHGPLLEAHSGFEIVSVMQRNPAKPARHPYRVVNDFEEILSDESVELVVVNTPNDSHHRYAAQALKASKHVIVEKPFTVTVQEADELIELAKQQKRMLTVFQNRRWDADFLTVRKVLDAELLGKLVECEIHYDRYRNYIEPDTWKEEAKAGTGILYNLGSHLIDQALVLFGMPRYVDARIGIQRPGGRVDDFFDIRLEYDGFLTILKSSYLVREQGPRFILHGTEGSFLKAGIDPQEQALKDKKTPGMAGWGAEDKQWWGKLNTTVNNKHIEGPYETVPGNYLSFYDNVYDVLVNGGPLAVKAEESRNVILLIEACQESNRKRSALKL